MSVSAAVTIGSRPSLELGVSPWTLELSAGSDFEGGLVATAMVKRTAPWPVGEHNWVGIHAANGKHARWGWYGVDRQTMFRGWRIAIWTPSHIGVPLLAPDSPA